MSLKTFSGYVTSLKNEFIKILKEAEDIEKRKSSLVAVKDYDKLKDVLEDELKLVERMIENDKYLTRPTYIFRVKRIIRRAKDKEFAATLYSLIVFFRKIQNSLKTIGGYIKDEKKHLKRQRYDKFLAMYQLELKEQEEMYRLMEKKIPNILYLAREKKNKELETYGKYLYSKISNLARAAVFAIAFTISILSGIGGVQAGVLEFMPYAIQKGETISGVCKKYGLNISEIMGRNNLTAESVKNLKPGDVVQVPKGSVPSTDEIAQKLNIKNPKIDSYQDLYKDDDTTLLARMIFGENRDQSNEAKIASGSSALNRLKIGKWGTTLKEVILKGKQYSCFNTGNPNLPVLRDPLRYNPSEWVSCYNIAKGLLEGTIKPMDKVTHYHMDYVKLDWTKGKKPFKTIQTKRGKMLLYSLKA
jgi:LysM repeat protein